MSPWSAILRTSLLSQAKSHLIQMSTSFRASFTSAALSTKADNAFFQLQIHPRPKANSARSVGISTSVLLVMSRHRACSSIRGKKSRPSSLTMSESSSTTWPSRSHATVPSRTVASQPNQSAMKNSSQESYATSERARPKLLWKSFNAIEQANDILKVSHSRKPLLQVLKFWPCSLTPQSQLSNKRHKPRKSEKIN